nr:uncharacterized protein LOC109766306 [Aegilops tauschii subsp. strangulata]
MASPGSSGTTRSHRTNPFEGPHPVVIRDLNILARVPVVLDHLSSTYYAWKTYFSLVFHEYNLRDHIDGSVDSRFMEDDEEWTSIDATLIRWFYTTISKDLFHTVVSADDDAQAVWTKLNGLFTGNALQRKVFLHDEFFGCQQLDSSVDDYCMRLTAECRAPGPPTRPSPPVPAALRCPPRRLPAAARPGTLPGSAAARVSIPAAAAGHPAEQPQRRGGRRGRGGRKQQQQQPAAHGGAPRHQQQQPAP